MYYGQQIIQVNGEESARQYQMPPNSSTLLLDANEPIVYVVVSDGAGYKTVTPYEVKPYERPKPIDMNAVMERLNRIEERLNESNTEPTEPKRKSTKTTNADE